MRVSERRKTAKSNKNSFAAFSNEVPCAVEQLIFFFLSFYLNLNEQTNYSRSNTKEKSRTKAEVCSEWEWWREAQEENKEKKKHARLEMIKQNTGKKWALVHGYYDIFWREIICYCTHIMCVCIACTRLVPVSGCLGYCAFVCRFFACSSKTIYANRVYECADVGQLSNLRAQHIQEWEENNVGDMQKS